MLLGEFGYPARPEEIIREGWKSRQLVRVHPPPPLTRSSASVTKEEMSKENWRQPWGKEAGGGEKRRFEEDRGRSRFQQEQDRGGWREDERRREIQFRDHLERGRGGAHNGGPNQPRPEEEDGKRRALDNRRTGYKNNDEPRNRINQGTQHIPVPDRLGGGGRNQMENREEEGLRRGQNTEMKNQSQAGICFWCRHEGHHQAECTNPPFCFRCKNVGHISARCPTAKGASMHLYGYGFPGQGLYSLMIPGDNKQLPNEHQGLIIVEKGGMTENKMEDELKHLIDDKWSWKVKKVSNTEFLAVFPNKQILEVFSKSVGFTMTLYNTWATVTPSSRDPAASSMLQTGWIQMYNVPDRARNLDAATLIAELAGEVVTVDELSLIKDEAVRVKIKAREIEKIRGFVEIFIEGVGYEIKFVPEKGIEKGKQTYPPPPPPRQDREDSEEEEEEDLLGGEAEEEI